MENILGIADAQAGYHTPMTCRGVSARKIFRDGMWGDLRFPFRADHRYYRKHGMYDFPQKDIKTRIINAIMAALSAIPPVRESIERDMKKYMVMPYQKMLDPQGKSVRNADAGDAAPLENTGS